jgi:hypothetical protein
LTFKNQFDYKNKLVFFDGYHFALMLGGRQKYSVQICDLIIKIKKIQTKNHVYWEEVKYQQNIFSDLLLGRHHFSLTRRRHI